MAPATHTDAIVGRVNEIFVGVRYPSENLECRTQSKDEAVACAVIVMVWMPGLGCVPTEQRAVCILDKDDGWAFVLGVSKEGVETNTMPRQRV